MHACMQVFCSKLTPNCGACPLQAGCEYALNKGKRFQSHTPPSVSAQHQVRLSAFRTDLSLIKTYMHEPVCDQSGTYTA